MIDTVRRFFNKINISSYGFIAFIFIVIASLRIIPFYSYDVLINSWAEEHFYRNFAIHCSTLRNLFIADAGYLNMLPRVIALFLAKVLHIHTHSYFYAMFKILNVLVLAAFLCCFLSRDFEKVFGDNRDIRLGVLLLLALFPHSDMSASFNSGYASIVPLMWFIIRFDDDRPVSYLYYPLYLFGIVLVFVCKLSIVCSTIPIMFIVLLKKMLTKNYTNFFLICFATACSVTSIVYSLYFKELYLSGPMDGYIVPQFTVQGIWGIIDFILQSTGISLLGYAWRADNINFFAVRTIVYFFGVIFVCYSFAFVFYRHNIKQFLCTKNIVMMFLCSNIVIHAMLNSWNTYYHFYDGVFKMDRYLFHRQWWPIFASTLMAYVIIFNRFLSVSKFTKYIRWFMGAVFVLSMIAFVEKIAHDKVWKWRPNTDYIIHIDDWKYNSEERNAPNLCKVDNIFNFTDKKI